jgi:hypothetical protein
MLCFAALYLLSCCAVLRYTLAMLGYAIRNSVPSAGLAVWKTVIWKTAKTAKQPIRSAHLPCHAMLRYTARHAVLCCAIPLVICRAVLRDAAS